MIDIVIYSVLSLWGVVTTYLLFEVFYDTKDIKVKKKLILFGVYFVVINVVYLTINIPIVNLITNITIFFIISLNYKVNLQKNLVSIILIYIILLSGESISSMLLSYSKAFIIEGGVHTPIENLFFGKLTTFLTVIFIGKYADLKKEGYLSYKNWSIIIIIAVISMYLIILLLSINNISLTLKAVGIVGLLVINLAVIYLYSSILGHLQNEFDKKIYDKELEYRVEQFNTIKESLDNVRIFNHDLNNHLSLLNTMIENGEIEKALNHIKKLMTEYYSKSNIVNTGNIIIDSIINVKIPKMEELSIIYELDISVPYDLELSSITMMAILGNAIDNAIEAVAKLEMEERWIKVKIKYNKDKLIIHLENPYKEPINIKEEGIITSKDDKINHGIGLKSILAAVTKEKGLMRESHENNIFTLDIMI